MVVVAAVVVVVVAMVGGGRSGSGSGLIQMAIQTTRLMRFNTSKV